MGADGGIKITKVSDIKKDWLEIRINLLTSLEYDLKKSIGLWETNYIQNSIDGCNKLPDDISGYSGEDIVKMFSFMSSCDCPYLYEDSIITAVGDNVSDDMNTLSFALNGISIETWT